MNTGNKVSTKFNPFSWAEALLFPCPLLLQSSRKPAEVPVWVTPCPRNGQAYLCVGARFSLFVVFVTAPLVQFGPEGFGLPVVELGLELGVEGAVIFGLQFQVVTELLEGPEGSLAGRGLDKVVKEAVSLVGCLLLPLLHAPLLLARPPRGSGMAADPPGSVTLI